MPKLVPKLTNLKSLKMTLKLKKRSLQPSLVQHHSFISSPPTRGTLWAVVTLIFLLPTTATASHISRQILLFFSKSLIISTPTFPVISSSSSWTRSCWRRTTRVSSSTNQLLQSVTRIRRQRATRQPKMRTPHSFLICTEEFQKVEAVSSVLHWS